MDRHDKSYTTIAKEPEDNRLKKFSEMILLREKLIKPKLKHDLIIGMKVVRSGNHK